MEQNQDLTVAPAVLDPGEVDVVRRRIESFVRELEGLLNDIAGGSGDTLAPGERRVSTRYAAVKTRILQAPRRSTTARRPTTTLADRVYWEPAVHAASAGLRAPVNCSRRETLIQSVAAALQPLRSVLAQLDDMPRGVHE